jgi:hypothetical protein
LPEVTEDDAERSENEAAAPGEVPLSGSHRTCMGIFLSRGFFPRAGDLIGDHCSGFDDSSLFGVMPEDRRADRSCHEADREDRERLQRAGQRVGLRKKQFAED